MEDHALLIWYKFARVTFLVGALLYIFFYVYNRKRKASLEAPKYRMLDED